MIVTLRTLFLHRAEDLSDYRTFNTAGVREALTVAGRVGTYAQGNQRLVLGKARPTALSVPLVGVSLEDQATLREWAGQVLLLRDPVGRALTGTYLVPQIETWKAETRANVTFEFLEVTHSLEV